MRSMLTVKLQQCIKVMVIKRCKPVFRNMYILVWSHLLLIAAKLYHRKTFLIFSWNLYTMNDQYIATVSVTINANPARIWHVLTDAAEVKKYMFDTEIETDWQKGSAITYSGIWKGKEYKDKGTIIEIIPGKKLHTTHYSPLSGKPDVPENYVNVIYTLEPGTNMDTTVVTITQDKIESLDSLEHMKTNWQMILDGLKNVVEK